MDGVPLMNDYQKGYNYARELAIDQLVVFKSSLKEAEEQRDAALAALKLAKAFGSQGETHDGLSVSTIIDKVIVKAEGIYGGAGD